MNKITLAVSIVAITAAVFADTNEVRKSGKIRMLEKTGGYIEQALPQGAKVVSIVDSRAAKDSAVTDFQTAIKRTFGIPSVAGVADNAAVSITLKDGGELVANPVSGAVEVPAGKDTAETVANLWKGLLTVFAYASEPMSQGGAMVISHALPQMGIPQIRRVSYKNACEEGWAPAPTNEFQKAIWEKVKAEKEAAAKPDEATETK